MIFEEKKMFKYFKLNTFLLLLIIQTMTWKNKVEAATSQDTLQEGKESNILRKVSAPQSDHPKPSQSSSFIQRINGLRQDEASSSSSFKDKTLSDHQRTPGSTSSNSIETEKPIFLNYFAMEKDNKVMDDGHQQQSSSKDIPPPLTYRKVIELLTNWQRQKEQNFYHLNSAADLNRLTPIGEKKSLQPISQQFN